MKKKLLVLGVSGLTGFKIATLAKSKYEVYGTFNSRPIKIDDCNISKLKVNNSEEIQKIFSEIKPDKVINTTALHNVDYCEENPHQAHEINTTAVKLLSENSEKSGSRLIHISTDYVFDGEKNTPYSEKDLAIPISTYGQSKLDGEKILDGSNNVVLRPSVVFGWTPMELSGTVSSSGKPMNFAIWLLTKLHKKEPFKIVTDQFSTSTLADSLAESALKILESNKGGLYHVSGLSCESRYEFSIKLVKKFGYDPSIIEKTDSTQFKQKAKRPAYSCLNCEKAIKEFELKLLTSDEALDIMKKQVEKEAPHLIGDRN